MRSGTSKKRHRQRSHTLGRFCKIISHRSTSKACRTRDCARYHTRHSEPSPQLLEISAALFAGLMSTTSTVRTKAGRLEHVRGAKVMKATDHSKWHRQLQRHGLSTSSPTRPPISSTTNGMKPESPSSEKQRKSLPRMRWRGPHNKNPRLGKNSALQMLIACGNCLQIQ